MWRKVHSVLALTAAALLVVIALSGTWLSLYPVTGAMAPPAPVPAASMSVAKLAGRVASEVPGVETLTRSPSGTIIASYTEPSGAAKQGYVDPATGRIASQVGQGSTFYDVLMSFHRSLFLGNAGRIVVGVAALVMTLIALSGLVMLVNRMGGWARLFDRPRGRRSARLHVYLSRLAILPLVLSATTGMYLTLVQFQLLPNVQAQSVQFPESTQGLPAVSPGTLAGLKDIPVSNLRSLQFPYQGDKTDVFTATTNSGVVVVDQFTGKVLERDPATTSQKIYEFFYALHTGQGLPWIGAILGLAAALVPIIAGAGVVIWWRRRAEHKVRLPASHPAHDAEVVILVGSEGGTTWGFARALYDDLVAAGKKVHFAPMSSFRNRYDRAEQVLFVTATYGDGHAPSSAGNVMARLSDVPGMPDWSYAVLGFGDRAFPHYCQFAKDLDGAMADRGWRRMIPTSFINRQSTQAFATWSAELGKALGVPLDVQYTVARPETMRLRLIDKQVYGTEVQSPTAVLRFELAEAAATKGVWARMMRVFRDGAGFGPSSVLGVMAPGGEVPRYYSIASDASDDEVEICVRKMPGGLCSSYLYDLTPGEEIDAFTKPNPDFTPAPGRRPIIMIGTGTGVAPLVGMIRANQSRRPIHLIFGGRSPSSDFLYGEELHDHLADGQLSTLTTAFSRTRPQRAYVQDKVRADAARIAELVRKGASVMVCGGDAMAQAVRAEFDAALAPFGLNVGKLKAKRRYLEDIF